VFKGLGNLAQLGTLFKQAQQMGGKLEELNRQLKSRTVEGSAGGGLVSVEANGLGEVLRCRIDPTLLNGGDRELVEDLLPAAINQAISKAKQLHAEAMQSLTAGVDLPGLGEILSQLSGGGFEKPNS
jgi:nucleoid-associated protein EbfC